MPDNADLALLLRMLAAGVFSGAIGYERESAGKSAGLRTHMLVAMASAFFVAIGEQAVVQFGPSAAGALRYDPLRIIQAVVVGIGFLGGGIIFVDADRTRTQGLTTAASVWATAGIGIAAGLGRFWAAAGAAVLFLGVLRVMVRLDRADR